MDSAMALTICADGLEIMLPSWYVRPGNVDLKAGGDSSLRWMGMTPQLVLSAFGQIEGHRFCLRSLNVELQNESGCSKTAKRVR